MKLLKNARKMCARLDFEKCEDRNLLAASSVVEMSAFENLANEHLILNHLAGTEHTAYLQKGAFDLQLVSASQNKDGMTSSFQQTMDGLPVHGSSVIVTQDVSGNILDVADRAFTHLSTQDSLKPGLNANDAHQIANTGFDSRIDFTSEADLVWFNNGDRTELAWQVTTTAIGVDANNADIELTSVVDANTGTMLSQSQSTLVADDLVTNQDTGVQPRITINDALGAAGSRAYAAPFDSVVELNLGCTGTLIASNVVLSARHCGAGSGSTIDFGDNGSSPIYTAVVQSSSLPDGNGSLLDGGDVAILTLTANVPTNIATPMRLIDATNDLVGLTASLSGYGLNGLGSTGHGGTSDGWRWGGENVIDRYGTPASASGANIISTDFDDGSSGSNTIGGSSATPLTFEATTAGGDSGGAVFVQQGGEWLIAGVLSGGTTGNSVYGDISWWTGTAIYRAEIEAVGGVFADGGLGTVGFDAESYFFDDTVSISVNDSNATGPLSVVVTSDAGDTETVTLTGAGPFVGSITVVDAAVSANDGTLQAADGNTITVTYIDADDGSGSSNTVNDTALVFEPADGELIGIDFDDTGSVSPSNWNLIGGGSNTTINNLQNENGDATVIDLAITELSNGTWDDFEAVPIASTIPQHANSLTNIDGQIYTAADPIQFVYQELTAGTDYEIYIFSVDSFFDSIEQTVTITGAGSPVSFDQIFDSGELMVNDQIGSSSQNLQSYAQVIEADVNGEITINVTPIAGTSDVVVGGLAIQEVPADEPLLDPIGSKFLDGVVVAGTLSDAQVSDDVYLQLDPSPTTNLIKQKVDVILTGEYAGGTTTNLGFRLEAVMNGGPAGDVIQTVRFRNQDLVWEVIDVRAVDSTESVVEVFATGDVNRFMHPTTGETLVRIEWASESFTGSPFTWSVDVDQWGWMVS